MINKIIIPASSSVATEWLKGRTVDDCLTIKNTDIAQHLKLPPVKLHCSMLAEDAIKAAITDYKSKQKNVVIEKAGGKIASTTNSI
jgi:NifU-like protein involved in Fe-S cluster formation